MASRKISDLHPYVQKKAGEFLNKCRAEGIEVLIYCTLRTNEEQDKLYAQGRTKPGKRVTNAKGGQSYHNYGVAFDCVPTRGGKPIWNDTKTYKRMGEIGTSIGLEWGGNFKSITDMPHFQMSGGLSTGGWKHGYKPNFPEEPVKSELDIKFDKAIQLMASRGVINSPNYWINSETYSKENVKLLFTKVVDSYEN